MAATSTRLGSAMDEKAFVQSRIKALIGYREPQMKSSAAIAPAKPRMSVCPQPLIHSRSSTMSTSLKHQQQPPRGPSSSSDLVNTSTAAVHYASSSAIS